MVLRGLFCLALLAGQAMGQTQFKHPQKAFPECQVESCLLFDAVDKNWHVWQNGRDTVIYDHPRLQDLMPLPEPIPPSTGVITVHLWDMKEPDPNVVPAIQETRDAFNAGITITCGGGAAPWDMKTSDNGKHYTCQRWTCADPSRVLLHSLDGKQHWCVRF